MSQLSDSRLENFRELAGLAVAGGTIRSGAVWRSDDVSFIPYAQAEELVGDGLSTVIDLRSPQEASFTGRGPLASMDVDHHTLPLTDEMALPEVLARARLRGATPTEVGEWYADVAVERAPAIARGLGIIADAPGAVLFHCSAGKDRTGIFAAALLSALGAVDDTIMADYGRTAAVLPAVRARLAPIVQAILGTTPRPTDPRGASLGADPENMRAMLDTLRERSGGLAELMSAHGLTGTAIERLRERVLRTA